MTQSQKTITISRAQAEAARMLVETADKWGEPVPAGVRAMARALSNGHTTVQAEKHA
jgi:hypothetical protein